jgi:hypothetical protein
MVHYKRIAAGCSEFLRGDFLTLLTAGVMPMRTGDISEDLSSCTEYDTHLVLGNLLREAVVVAHRGLQVFFLIVLRDPDHYPARRCAARSGWSSNFLRRCRT